MKTAAALALSASLLTAPVHAEQAWSVELAGQQEWQQWRETASDGRRLVAEDGRLVGLTATLRWTPTEAAALALSLGVLQGGRSTAQHAAELRGAPGFLDALETGDGAPFDGFLADHEVGIAGGSDRREVGDADHLVPSGQLFHDDPHLFGRFAGNTGVDLVENERG